MAAAIQDSGLSTQHSALNRLAPELVPVICLVGAAVVVFRDALVGGEVFYEQDTEIFYYPLTRWFATQLQAGHLPLWIPHLFGGYPILADGEIGPLYPLQLAGLLLFGPERAFLWLRPLHFALAAGLMYALMRVLGAGRLGGTVGGLTFAFGGFLAPQMHHENVVRTAVWLPLVLLLAELALRRHGWAHHAYLAAAGLALGVALLGLHVQPALMMAMALGLYFVVGGWRLKVGVLQPSTSNLQPLLRAAWALGLVLGLGAALGAVQWVPLYELGRASFRGQGVGYEFASAFGVAPANLPTLLFPYFFRLADGTWWMLWTPWETLFYAGVVPLLLAPLGLLRAPRRLALFFVLLGALALLVAMSHYGPANLHEALWRLPGLSFLRAPGRFSYLFVFAIAGLAAFGADWLASPARRRLSLSLVAAALLGLLGLLVALLQSWHAWLLADPAAARAFLEATYLALRRQSEQPSVDVVYQGLLWSTDLANPKTLLSLGLIGGLAVLVLLRAWRSNFGFWILDFGLGPVPIQNPKSKIQNWNAALVGLVALDLLVFAYDFHPRATLETLGQPGPLLQALAEQGGARLLAGPGIAALEPNRPLLAGLDDLSGYSSLPNQRHFDYWSRARATPNVLLDLWGAGLYISSDDQPDAVQREGYTLYPTQPLLEGSAGGPAGEEAFRVPDVAATEVRLVGSLSHAVEVAEGSLVGEVVVVDTAGRVRQLPLRAGQHLAERAYDRADVSPAVRHSRPPVLYSTEEWSVDGSLFPVHAYLARLPLGERVAVSRLVVRALGTQGELNVFGLALAEGDGAPSYSVRPTDREKLQPLRRVGSASIYRNTRAFPRAFVVAQAVGLDPAHRESPLVQMLSSPFDPAQEVLLERFPEPLPLPSQVPRASELSYLIPAQVEELSTEHVRVRADLGAAGFLVLTDLYHRGWQARVDGQSAPLYLADSLFRAVPVPAGQHVVDFVFDPISLRLGAFLSLEALLFAALLLAGPALARWVGRLKGMPVRV